MAQPELFRITRSDKQSALDSLIEGATPDASFYLLLILSTVIVTLGLIDNNTAVVIGGMLVAPLLSPILSVAMSVVMADFELLKKSGQVLFVSILVVVFISFLLGLASIDVTMNEEILTRTQWSFSALVIAIAAGIAAAFAFARPKLSATFPGVAVSIALLPPISVGALGIVLADSKIILGGLGLFFVNLLGIIGAAMVVFSLMGFFEQREEAQEKLDEKEEEMAHSK